MSTSVITNATPKNETRPKPNLAGLPTKPTAVFTIPANPTFPSSAATTLIPENWQQILPSECGLSVKNKVTGGVPASIESNPWQVGLVDTISKELKCGGSVISKKHVLTATHCFLSKHPDTDEVKIISKSERLVCVGNENIKDALEEFRILDLFLHPKYSTSHKRNDIALIMIDGDFLFSHQVFPICLPEKNVVYSVNRACTVSGWGKTSSDTTTTTENLKVAVVKMIDSAVCKQKYTNLVNISGGMFCAGDLERGSVDTCQGDSGGPLTCREDGKGTIFGITSWGWGCGRANYPGVYVKVSLYLNWIRERLKISVGARSRDSLTFSEDEDVGAPIEIQNKNAEPVDPEEDIL